MLSETKSDGLFRFVRLTRHFAFKTPHILNRKQLKTDLKLLGTPRGNAGLLAGKVVEAAGVGEKTCELLVSLHGNRRLAGNWRMRQLLA
jgi:hypothetical protein